MPYAHVHYCLRQERHHQLQQASEREAEEDVEEIFPVLLQVTEKEAERAFLIFTGCGVPAELFCRLEKQCNPFLLPMGIRAEPVFFKFPSAVDASPLSGVSYVESLSVSGNLVKHHEMVLVPVQDGGERAFAQTVYGNFSAAVFKPQSFCGIADAFERYALDRGVAYARDFLQRLVPAEMAAHHSEACRAALHRVALSYCLKLPP